MIETIAAYGSQYNLRHTPQVRELLVALADRGVSVRVEQGLLQLLHDTGVALDHPKITDGGLTPQGEVAISLGGDGTLLRTVHLLRDVEIPIWAINCGRLGFMTDMEPEEALNYLPALVSETFRVEGRTMLDVWVDGAIAGTALNDVAIQKRETGSLIHITTELDDTLLAEYAADGLVVSTPSGSTAYSLSVGGPIVMPQSATISLTPIAPHSLRMAPLIYPDTSELRMRVSSRHETFAVVIDGEMRTYDCGVEIIVRKSDKQAHLIRLSIRTHVDTIREKLHWGIDLR